MDNIYSNTTSAISTNPLRDTSPLQQIPLNPYYNKLPWNTVGGRATTRWSSGCVEKLVWLQWRGLGSESIKPP